MLSLTICRRLASKLDVCKRKNIFIDCVCLGKKPPSYALFFAIPVCIVWRRQRPIGKKIKRRNRYNVRSSVCTCRRIEWWRSRWCVRFIFSPILALVIVIYFFSFPDNLFHISFLSRKRALKASAVDHQFLFGSFCPLWVGCFPPVPTFRASQRCDLIILVRPLSATIFRCSNLLYFLFFCFCFFFIPRLLRTAGGGNGTSRV